MWKALSAPAGNGQGLEDVEKSGRVVCCQASDLGCNRRTGIVPWTGHLHTKIPFEYSFLGCEGLQLLSERPPLCIQRRKLNVPIRSYSNGFVELEFR